MPARAAGGACAATLGDVSSPTDAILWSVMDSRLLLLPALIAVPALLILGATWGANTLARWAARWVALRPRFTPTERRQLRRLRDRYRRERVKPPLR